MRRRSCHCFWPSCSLNPFGPRPRRSVRAPRRSRPNPRREPCVCRSTSKKNVVLAIYYQDFTPV